jgi:hypothetical protein
MKLICPNCMKPVSVPEEAAGTEAGCPNCGRPFPVPARYNPVVAPPPPTTVPPVVHPEPVPMPAPPTADRPPPGLVPTALVPQAPPGEAAVPPPPPVPAGYTRSFGIVFTPRWVAWVPVVGLTVALVATFFPWVGSYFAGYPVYTQSPWQAVTGAVNRDFKLENPAVRELGVKTEWVGKVPSDWELMLPYFLLLILATVLAWGDRLVPTLPDPHRLPPPLRWLPGVWPHRALVLAGLAGLSLVLLVGELSGGLGMERAIRRAVADDPGLVAKRKEAGNDPAKQAAADYAEQQELDKYNLRRTWALTIAFGTHLLAVLGLGAVAMLHRRGTKPPPRILMQY